MDRIRKEIEGHLFYNVTGRRRPYLTFEEQKEYEQSFYRPEGVNAFYNKQKQEKDRKEKAYYSDIKDRTFTLIKNQIIANKLEE